MAPTILAFFTTFLPILYCVWLSVFFSRKTLFVLVVFALFWVVNAILLEEAPGIYIRRTIGILLIPPNPP